MKNCINTKSLEEKNDSGNVSLRFSRMRLAVTRNLRAGHQHECSRLGFPVPLPAPPFNQGRRKEGGGETNLDLVRPRWLESSCPFALGFGL